MDWSLFDFGSEWYLQIATVTDSQFREEAIKADVGFERQYVVDVTYQYTTFEGETFTRAINTQTTDQNAALQQSQRYALGAQFAVWYHPRIPELVFTEQFGPIYDIVLLVIGGLLMFWGLSRILSSIKYWRLSR